MKIIIPSKNRPMQLHLLLESLCYNFNKSLDIKVIYKATDDKYRKGYSLLRWRFKNVHFIEETDFREDFLGAIDTSCDLGIPITGIFTDDCVIYRKTELAAHLAENFYKDERILCFSMRLGKNTIIQDYLTGSRQQDLTSHGGECDVSESYFVWPWIYHPQHYNYGYFLSLDGHFYRSNDLYSWLIDKNFNNPRGVEHQIITDSSIRHNMGMNRPLMMSEGKSSMVTNTINQVQKDGGPPSGVFHSYSEEFLNEKYLNNYIIDLNEFMKESNRVGIESSHTELPLEFKLYEESE